MSTYAISDLHGRYDLYQEVMKFVKSEDKIYFLGDAADRGPEGWRLIKEIYANPQIIYLMGNHEHILLNAMKEYLGEDTNVYEAGAMNVCGWNGGADTLKSWIDEGAKRSWIDALASLPRKVEHDTPNGCHLILSHAGFQPQVGKDPTPYDLIWDRRHLRYQWPKDKEFEHTILVHGHTPIPYIAGDDWEPREGIITYLDGHKMDIDMGAFFTGWTCLLDLDTFDEHYFSVK